MLQSPCTISRLKGFFRSGINYSCYEEILNTTKRKASGSLPKDILSCLILNNTDRKSAIQGTENLLTKTADILGEINKLEIQAINRMPIKDCFYQMSHLFMGGDVNGLYRSDALFKEKELETIIRAEEKTLSEIKKYIPEIQNVIITSCGGGKFGIVYRLQILGKDGQQIFGDKALKVYRGDSFWRSFEERCKRYMKNTSDTSLVENFNKERELYKKHGIILPAKTAEAIRSKAKENLELIFKSETKSIHGAPAEANISEFLRFFSGHNVTSKEGIAIPTFYSLGNTKFSLGEFVGKNIQPKRKFYLERLFVKNDDIELTPDNAINGIYVDMGGIIPLLDTKQVKEIFSSKKNMRLIKSLLSSPKDKRGEILEKYKKAGMLPEEVLSQLEKYIN